ncbi:hypothetical protein ACFOHS_10770 [Jhaorihella thermophila]
MKKASVASDQTAPHISSDTSNVKEPRDKTNRMRRILPSARPPDLPSCPTRDPLKTLASQARRPSQPRLSAAGERVFTENRGGPQPPFFEKSAKPRIFFDWRHEINDLGKFDCAEPTSLRRKIAQTCLH